MQWKGPKRNAHVGALELLAEELQVSIWLQGLAVQVSTLKQLRAPKAAQGNNEGALARQQGEALADCLTGQELRDVLET
jgi:hypothetical protein